MMRSDLQFHPDELMSIQSGIKEFETDQIEFEHPAIAAGRLKKLWWFDQHGCPTIREATQGKVSYLRVPRDLPGEPDWFIGMSHEFTKAIQSIDRKLQGRILEAMSYISSKPTVSRGDTVKPLTGDLKGLWRYRIGDYRLVYYPDTQNKRIVLVTFTSRGSAYA